jgi:hypothetical protein
MLIYILGILSMTIMLIMCVSGAKVDKEPLNKIPSPRPPRRDAVTEETLDEKIKLQEREEMLNKVRRRLKPKADAV